MKGIHILSTAPSGNEYHPAFFETVAMVLSALLWKKHNGAIHLYTDQKGFRHLEQSGISYLWDSIDIQVLESLPNNIDWTVFWAGAKLFSLSNETAPVAMIDTDLFIWSNFDSLCAKHELVTLHREELIDCYPPKNKLPIAEGYMFPEGLDWSIKPCNTAFAYFANNSFKDLYVQEAVRYMCGNGSMFNDKNARMVFAEQRLLAMLAKREGIDIGVIIDDPFSSENQLFTHLWGAKALARKNPFQRARLENAILRKIKLLSKSAYDILSRQDRNPTYS